MLYVVMGMHKSGTTLVSQVLHHSGIPMDGRIDEAVSYDQGNKYERQSVLRVNMGMTGGHGFDEFWSRTPEQMDPDAIYRPRIRQIIDAGEAAGGDWGFKDPRLALTYPLWREEMPPHKIIFIYREMSEVWPRYRYNHLWYFSYNFELAWKHVERWYVHNAAIVRDLQNRGDGVLVLDYRELMTSQAEFDRLRAFVGRDLEDRRRPDLYRTKKQRSIHLHFADRRLKKKHGVGSAEFMKTLHELRRRNIAETAGA